MAVVDEAEEDVEGLLDMSAVLAVRGLEVDEGDIAKAGDAVAGLVVGVVDREDAELGAGLGEEQHDDPVEVPQALAREVLRVERHPSALLSLADVVDDGVGEQLDAAADAVAQLLADSGRLGARLLEQARQDALGLVAGIDRAGAEQRGDRRELALGLRVVAGEGVVEVCADADAFAPTLAVQERDGAAGDEQQVARGVVGGEDELCRLEGSAGGGLLVEQDRFDETARRRRLAGDDRGRVGREDGIERDEQHAGRRRRDVGGGNGDGLLAGGERQRVGVTVRRPSERGEDRVVQREQGGLRVGAQVAQVERACVEQVGVRRGEGGVGAIRAERDA